MRALIITYLLLALSPLAVAQEISAPFVELDEAFFTQPNPVSAEWSKAAPSTVMLFPQNITTPSIYEASVAQLDVRALHNGSSLALLLSWADSSADNKVSLDHFTDACAIQFPVKAVETTSPFMGNKGAPVSVLHWKAIWQKDIDEHYQKVVDLYPNTWVDSDLFGKSVAIDAKNPVAQTQRVSPVEELMAEGFGTLTTQQDQQARGRGLWKDGKWSVVITRPLASQDKHDPALEPGQKSSVAFALWEGGHDNVGARKNYAPWLPLVLGAKP